MTRHRTLAVALAATCWRAAPLPAQTAPAWEVLSSGVTASLRGLSVVNDRVVWASGSRGTVLRTIDGGSSWSAFTLPDAGKLDVRAISGRSERVAHAAATTGRIWRTTDGGTTWTLQYQAPDTSVFLDALVFWDERRGMALGDPIGGRFFILVTDDGGDSWHEAPMESRPQARPGEAAYAASGTSLVLWASGQAVLGTGGMATRVHRSSDGGRSWTAIDVGMPSGSASAGIFSVAVGAGGRMIAVGGDYRAPDSTRDAAAWSGDGGRSWHVARTPPHGYRSGVAFAAARVALAVGTNGTDYSTDAGATWTRLDTHNFNAVQVAPSGMAFAAGDRGGVGRLDTRALAAPR